MTKKKYKNWTLIDWDGNPDLKLKCWRKSFGRGHVSVGVGDFQSIVYSHGDNSDESLSGTRWNYDEPLLTEKQAMNLVDENRGYHDYKNELSFRRRLKKSLYLRRLFGAWNDGKKNGWSCG